VDTVYKGKRFFDSLTFHRVIKDFMIQGGDPLGNGMGNPGYRFPDEFDESLLHDRKGILSMANSGPETNGSQFFITLKETPHLNGRHTVFGEVVVGMEIVDAIGLVQTGPQDKPVEPVVINTVNIINKGKVSVNSFEKEMEEIENERIALEERISKVMNETAAAMESQKAGAEELPSGLKILFLNQGDGEQPKEGDQVLIDYEGYLQDGVLFDTSILEIAQKYEMVDERREQERQYAPLPAIYSQSAQLIAGFKEGMLKMKVGDEALLYIPSHLGYGERGAGNVIPPNADLIFKLKLVEIAN
ncbi:MAG: peptidylprolyl isomerase, partial [Flavobacteriales bacterium]|nr:peptidylprolyl isomerase [Flavobacteriales bacterium]